MNMLDVEEDSFYVTREGYSHLSDSEWEIVGRMSVLMGEPAISGMLESLAETSNILLSTSSYKGILPSKDDMIVRYYRG
uniref:Uncharacterized protein n=1 Tax=Peronospora matthiolae TaxID=2874970 RepID=A0AAV1T6U8_9STRA